MNNGFNERRMIAIETSVSAVVRFFFLEVL
nr:MAG TPA: hypothetical protein [Caudoviricetes sp.]